jgi:uncharacterized membrane protein
MDKHETDERKALRARRLLAMVDVPDKLSEARTQRVATWVSVSVAVFASIFATVVAFGWMPLRLSLEIILCATSLVLVVGAALAAVNLWRSFFRAHSPSS